MGNSFPGHLVDCLDEDTKRALHRLVLCLLGIVDLATLSVIVFVLFGHFGLLFRWEDHETFIKLLTLFRSQLMISKISISLKSAQCLIKSIHGVAGECHESGDERIEENGRPSCQFVEHLLAIILNLLLI